MAEQDTTLARTGLAHSCFLLPLFTQGRPSSWPRYEPYHAGLWHTRVVKAYRARMRGYREQGMSFDKAQRLALWSEASQCGVREDGSPEQEAGRR